MSDIRDNIKIIDISNLDVKSNYVDIHYDIYQYINYISNKDIKRSTRYNALLKGDVIRLSKLMTIGEFKAHEFDAECDHYPGFIDNLAYNIKWVSYKKYTGRDYYYTPTYIDNYIKTLDDNYQKHLNLPLQQQEEKITKHLISDCSKKDHELIKGSPIGYLTTFSEYCSFDKINFPHVRVLLLNLISQLEPNNWYSVESLIYYLKLNHPYFLIPRKPESIKDSKEKNRYKGIYEDNANYNDIKSSDKNAFEKVEGRFVERFLEYIPFLMGYTELAYDFTRGDDVSPSMGQLIAFKPTLKLSHYMNKSIEEAKITVQPNFEISIESEIYPAQIMSELTSMAKVIKKDIMTQVKIEKNMVLQKIAKNSNFDPIKYLKKISRAELPSNLQIELKEWMKQSDSFILYEDMHLFESSSEFASVKKIAVDSINQNFNIIKNSNELYHLMEEDEEMPVKKVTHKDEKFLELPSEYKTIFKKIKNAKISISKNLEKLQIKKEIIIKLFFHSSNQLKIISSKLLDKGCVFSVNDNEKSITILQKNETLLKEVFKDISNQFQLDIKDK